MRAPDLRFFDELSVSEPKLGARSVETTYAVRRGKRTTRIPLRYTLDRVDLPQTPRMRNWARVLVTIPALNYGLFAKRLTLGYPIEREDLGYFRAMMDVTAREQYLTRFVRDEPHPLILPEYHVAPGEFDPRAVKRLARIAHAGFERAPRDADAPTPRDDAFIVLSSGGKESLLSYGLLRELGREVHPVYFNESGRHWWTALTSYRHHVARERNTKRIWSTTDRLYAAMNRLLPCVRPDFQRAGADVYPMQLFTFNNYQIASMGYALALGIGNLVMGNEFDEGPWPTVKGVRHYHGIFDQSQEFDREASAYYAAKGWGVRQLSIVRPLSCLTIQDALVTRYPDLAATQTSCHATHQDARGRVVPCGRCSKCLGILLFYGASGHDATRIRYAKRDVRALPARVRDVELKLDRGEAEHALSKLVRSGWPFAGSANGFEPREHPEVESLRYHPEMSARDELPRALRDDLEPLLARLAPEGARAWRAGRWRAVAVTGRRLRRP